MEMRPAKGRADIILGRPRFRCSRCGSKAASYFNIEDMNDPRAVKRLERLKAQEEMDEADIDEDEETDDSGSDKKKPPPPSTPTSGPKKGGSPPTK